MELYQLKSTSDDQLNNTIDYSPMTPDGDTSDLTLTIKSARNDTIDEEVQHLTDKARRMQAQMSKATGKRYDDLKAKRDKCELDLVLLLLVGFKGLTDGIDDEGIPIPVESNRESMAMLCNYYWVRESIVEKSTELSSFLGK